MTASLSATCSKQGGFPQWGAREKLPSTPNTRTSFPKRRGLREGYSGSHPSATDLLHHGPDLHDGIDAQRDYAELHKTLFQPWSHFGDYRHNYQKVVPTLKYFSASTFFASFLEPLTYEQLEAREGTLGATYCPDLLDLLLGLFSYMGIVPALWCQY